MDNINYIAKNLLKNVTQVYNKLDSTQQIFLKRKTFFSPRKSYAETLDIYPLVIESHIRF
jgi:hypothetical protein